MTVPDARKYRAQKKLYLKTGDSTTENQLVANLKMIWTRVYRPVRTPTLSMTASLPNLRIIHGEI